MGIKSIIEHNGQSNLAENDELYITNNPITYNKYSIYLTDEIGKYKKYRELFNLLRESDSTDTFILYLNNFGGLCHTGIEIINAMRTAKGNVVTAVTGPIYSMAPLIALSADKVYIDNNIFFMFHDYSGATVGKGHEQQSSIMNDKPFFDDMFKKITQGFLTKTEIKKIINGKDLYIGRDEIIKRLKKIGKLGNESK